MLIQLLDIPSSKIWRSVNHHQMFIRNPVVLPSSSLEQNEGASHTNLLHSLLHLSKIKSVLLLLPHVLPATNICLGHRQPDLGNNQLKAPLCSGLG